MTDRLTSGSDRLDAVLGGGLPRNGITLVSRAAREPARRSSPSNISSITPRPTARPCTCPPSPSRSRRCCATAQSLDYLRHLRAWHQASCTRISASSLNDDGLPGVLARDRRADQTATSRLDGHRQLQGAEGLRADDGESLRRFLHELAGRLSALPISSFWVGGYDAAPRDGCARVRRRRRHPVVEHRPQRRARDPRTAGSQAPRQRIPDRQAHLSPVHPGP